MRIKVSSPNPLSETQDSLGKIRREIKTQYPDSEIEVRDYDHRPDVTRCTVRITTPNGKSNWCTGSVISVGNPVERDANAELTAIALCCKELGIQVDFSKKPEREVLTVSPMERFDRAAVIQCKDLSQIMFRMKQYGLDTAGLIRYGADLKKQGKRLTKHAVAEYLFPESRSAVYVAPVESGHNVKRKAKGKKEVPVEAKIEVPTRKMQRGMQEAQELIAEIEHKGLTMDDVKSVHGSEFNSLLNFTLFATADELNQVLNP